MHYVFDLYGRFSGTSDLAVERSTPVAPPELTQDYNWNGVEWVFAPGIQTSPVVAIAEIPEPAPTPRTLSKIDYMDRFADAELAAIYAAAKTSIEVEIWLERFKLAQDVNLDDPRTQAGLMALEAVGLIGEGRAAEILS